MGGDLDVSFSHTSVVECWFWEGKISTGKYATDCIYKLKWNCPHVQDKTIHPKELIDSSVMPSALYLTPKSKIKLVKDKRS